FLFFFSSRRRHTRFSRDWSSDVCSSDLPRDIGQALIQNGFHQWIAACDHVADDEKIRLQLSLGGIKAFGQDYALFFKLRAHGRVDAGIATGNGMPCGSGDQRQSAHESAANAENMYVHGIAPWGRHCSQASRFACEGGYLFSWNVETRDPARPES